MAQAGLPVVGLDQSPAMLEVARRRIAGLDEEIQRRIELVEGDMADFSLGRRFRLIMIPFRSFLHLLSPQNQRRALGCIQKHLLELRGFQIEALYGDFQRGPFRHGGEQIWIARKA